MMMLFSILLITILLYSGWLSSLSREIKLPFFYIFLMISSLAYFLPMIPLAQDWFVHASGVVLLVAFLCLFWRLDHRKKTSLIVIFLSSGTIAFSFHEIFRLHADWTQLPFRLLLFILFALGGWLAFRDWTERVLYLLGGMFVTEGLILSVHHEMFNPVVLGNQAFLDACWMLMLLSIVFDLGIRCLPLRFRQDEGGL